MIKERTAELIKTTGQLQRELAERKRGEEEIQTSLKEKEVLIQEIHHRVKNNLQVISSLLNMYSRRIHDEQAVDLFTEVRNTIHSMALIHSELYQSERFDQINMERYLQRLANSLVQTYTTKRKWITINISPSDVYLSVNQVIPCALVLNELISNAFKHAFREGQEGKIEVSIQRSADGIVFVRVKDDGIGFPEEIDIYRTDSLGLKLVTNMVVDQLKGSIQLKREKGTEFIIEFKILGGVKDG
jgi:two-component sensor histidine kinase